MNKIKIHSDDLNITSKKVFFVTMRKGVYRQINMSTLMSTLIVWHLLYLK